MLRAVEHGVSAKVAVGVMRRFQELANRELVCGEALDVEFALRRLETIGLDEVREMLRGKTGALLRFCAEAGAMIALETDDPETPEVRKLGDFADAAGIAFQLRDDYLGIFGKVEQLGKAIGGDLREGKATILLLTALQMASAHERQRLLRLLGHREYASHDLDAVRRIMADCGAAAAIETEETELADRAKAILTEFPANVHRKCLLELVDYMITREK
jgi:geranylgeranyl diphosphate synthase type I